MSNEFKLVPFPRELAEVLMNTTTSSMARSEVISILAENPEENSPCPECGGSLSTWGCNCTPRWPMHKPIFAEAPQPPALGGDLVLVGTLHRDCDERIVFESSGEFHVKDGMPVYSDDGVASLQAEIERLKDDALTLSCIVDECGKERDQLKARCDELENLLLDFATQHDLPIAARNLCNAALSKAAGSEQ
jgi:hypothetical protein